MIGFGLFLILCGLLGWAATGFTERGKTAILSGGFSGAMMIALGWISGRPRPTLRDLGFYLGAISTLLFGGVFTWRAIVGWGEVAAGEPKLYVALLLSTMAAASFGAFGMLLAWRPRKEMAMSNFKPSEQPS